MLQPYRFSLDASTPGIDLQETFNTGYDRAGYDYSIDYEALGAHIVALHKAAITRNIKIWRVIFDPQLQPQLLKTQYGAYIKKHITLSSKRSWVRHDEHYHVDFIVKCKPL